ncbi:MAG: hypothetical protein ACOH19_05475 [Rhodoglobus sp.]
MGAIEQNEPVMDGANDATDAEKLKGIKEQTAADGATGAEAEGVVHERAEESGVEESGAEGN